MPRSRQSKQRDVDQWKDVLEHGELAWIFIATLTLDGGEALSGYRG